jgi:hypothetical protein
VLTALHQAAAVAAVLAAAAAGLIPDDPVLSSFSTRGASVQAAIAGAQARGKAGAWRWREQRRGGGGMGGPALSRGEAVLRSASTSQNVTGCDRAALSYAASC